MGFSDSDLIVLFVLGKKEKLSGSKIYEESKKHIECFGRRPEHKASIYPSIQKLMKEGYLKKVGEKRVRGTLERFYSLSERGQSAYSLVRETILVWEDVPDFRSSECYRCEDSLVEDCWEFFSEKLEAVVQRVFRRPNVVFEPSMLKTLFKSVGRLQEFIYWLNMLTAPKKIMTERFQSQIRALGLEQEECFRT